MPNKLSVDNRTDPPLALGRSPSSSSAPHTVGGSLGEWPMDGRNKMCGSVIVGRSVGRCGGRQLAAKQEEHSHSQVVLHRQPVNPSTADELSPVSGCSIGPCCSIGVN